MGTSWTSYWHRGFWATDGTVECWLQALVAEIDAHPCPAWWILQAREDWDLQATVGFVGSVCIDLDRHLAGDAGREADFLLLLNRMAGGGREEAVDAAHLFDGTPLGPSSGGAPAELLQRFTTAVIGLVRGVTAWDTTTTAPGVWPR